MTRTRWIAVSRRCLVAGLACTLPAAPLDDVIRGQIERSEVVADNPQTPGPLAFTLRYNVSFTNRAEDSRDIPDFESGPDRGASVILSGLQSQRPDGSWKYIVSPGMLAFLADTISPLAGRLAPMRRWSLKTWQTGSYFRETDYTPKARSSRSVPS